MKKVKAFITVKEVARYLGLHPLTVQKHAREGRLPAFKIGPEWKFETKHIQRWLKERSSKRTKQANSLFS